jgi:hypothetical protein
VAYAERSREGKPKASNITAMRVACERQGLKPIILVDAALRHDVDDMQQLDALIDKLIVRQTPAGVPGDYFVLRMAEEEGALVVSNDLYRQYREQFPWIDERRVPFMIVNGRVELYRPGLLEAEERVVRHPQSVE